MSSAHPPPQRPTGLRGVVFGISWLVIRGFLLWVVIPVTALVWVALWPLMRTRDIPLAQLIGWSDLNLVAAIEHTILRPLALEPYPWIAPSRIETVTHRVGTADPA